MSCSVQTGYLRQNESKPVAAAELSKLSSSSLVTAAQLLLPVVCARSAAECCGGRC